MKVALVNAINRKKTAAVNKDLAGGYGTVSDFGNSITSKMLTFVKKRTVRLPIISFAYLQAIFKERGDYVRYFEGRLPNTSFDFEIILIYGSIVDYKNENEICKQAKELYPAAIIGFFGPFPSNKPEMFNNADFILVGEAESFFLYEFKDVKQLAGRVQIKRLVEMDDLLTPCFDGFPINEYSYSPAIREKPFLVLQASRGCPYICAYYCPYGANQGARYRIRSAKNLIKDIEILTKEYNVKGIQFRDPTFGINKEQVKELCELIIERRIKIKWGIETRTDLLDRGLLKIMFDAGLRNINVGIETSDPKVARVNYRKLDRLKHQEEIISYCKKIGIKVSTFYILGLIGDTEESIRRTINYAVKLNTNVAQFTVNVPYPGTRFFDQLEGENKLLITEDFEKYNGNNVVFKHDYLNERELLNLREEAFQRFYFRPAYLWSFLKWRIREFYL